ncbi:MAG TPA: tripartite tricarboxylate transporter permease [Xanthobacteraceae bacterium]|nr:tripartite tricarboxylate transporter permease [Xanthobacteraceae bacterium]
MTAIFDHLSLGFGAALSLANLGFCLIGVLLGTLIGVLPGIGPTATIAMLLPLTFGMSPLAALIMLAGIYYGSQFGGSTTAILVNLPGESGSVVTCIDGHQMARQGRAGAALSIAAIGSFIAGTAGTIVIAIFGPVLAAFSQKFNSPEYFSLMVLGLVSAVVLAHGSLLKAVTMIFVGLLLGMVGTDMTTSTQRYTFGIPELSDGLGFVPVALGLFGLSEIIVNLERPETRSLLSGKITGLWITWQELKASIPAVLRGTGLGCGFGILPGGGPTLSAFASYTLEKKLAADPSRFGKGAIEGVAGPESANNAAAQTSFIPLLTLGIPSNAVMALMMGAMMIQGVAPGAQVMNQRPELFWGLIASMWIGNAMLLVINLPLVGLWASLLKTPYRMMFPCILAFSCIGIYSLNTSPFEVVVTAFFGVVGYVFAKLDCEPAPLLLGFVLGPLMETSLRRALLISRGDPMVFLERPISAVLLGLAALLLLIVIVPAARRGRETAFQE